MEDAMPQRNPKTIDIYLTDWQQRLIRDKCGQECIRWTVPLGETGGGRYRVGGPVDPKVPRMYLTDWQIRELKDAGGGACEYIEIDCRPISKYMPPLNR
jgi:hypothetical protein